MQFFPSGLSGRVSIVVLAAVCSVFFASSFIYRQAQISQVSIVRLSVLADELSSDLEMLKLTPISEREKLVARLTSSNLRLYIRDRAMRPKSADTRCIRRHGVDLGAVSNILNDAQFCVADLGSKTVGIRGAIALDDRSDLIFEMPHVLVAAAMRGAMVIAAVTALVVCGASAILIRALSTPLRALSSIAGNLTDVDGAEHTPVDEGGPREVRGLAHAINSMQTRIQKLVEDKTSVLAAVSHDLRTPLARLRLRADFLQDEESRQAIIDDIDEMEAMINGVLAYLSGESDPEVPRAIDLVAVISTLLDTQLDHGWQTSYAGPDRCLLTLRPIAIKRVFANLIQNACTYGGCAKVFLSVDESSVTVLVSDRGPGVPEHDLNRITDPFYRVESSRSRQTGGVGLGLAIVKREVRRAEGWLVFRNQAQGGLEVRVTLPRGVREALPSSRHDE